MISRLKLIFKTITLAFAFGIFFGGCKPDGPTPVEDLGFFPLGEIKEYHYFQPGSWWVYKNMISGELDTVVMARSNIDTIPVGNNIRKFSYEDITYTTTSITLKENYRHYRRYPMSAEPIDWKYFYYILRSRISDKNGFEGIQDVFISPDDISYGYADIILIENLDTLSLNSGIIVHNVKVFETDFEGDGSWDSYPTKYYWAKNVGLVKPEKCDMDKITLLDGWELIEYEITQ
jgi:hypothetical protein